MRVTNHNSRANKSYGVFGSKHNDRNFDLNNADHIDSERSQFNIYNHYDSDTEPSLSFEEVEKKFYDEHFKNKLDKMNQKSIEQRHPERVKTMDSFRMSKKSCCEEVIRQIGDKNESVDPRTLVDILSEQMEWERQTFPNCITLNYAFHFDEATPHLHERKVCNKSCIGIKY